MKWIRKATRKTSTPIHDEIAKIAADVASLGNVLGESASDEATAVIRSLRRRLDGLADDAGSLAEEAVDDARGAIASNPFIAVCLAFGLGALVAGLLRR